jgi:hypothetical protein
VDNVTLHPIMVKNIKKRIGTLGINMNNNNNESTIIISTIGYEQDPEPPIKKKVEGYARKQIK